MCPQSSGSPSPVNPDESHIERLYQTFIEGWNQRDSGKMAAGFESNGTIIGFDGSHHTGAADIQESVGRIFQQHATPPYLTHVRSIRFITPDVALLEAVVGMIPPQKDSLEPKLHAYQLLTAVRRSGRWMIAHLQNTPAQLHGRPAEVEAITQELLKHNPNYSK